MKKAEEASYNLILLADVDFVLAWSRREHERLVEERQRRLVDEHLWLEAEAAHRRAYGVIVIYNDDDVGPSHRNDGAAQRHHQGRRWR